jgi:hypothetical protein
MAPELTIEVYADTRRRGQCKGCLAPLWWATVVASGASLPFNDLPLFEVISTRTEDGRVIERVYRSLNHWATCPGRDLFTKRHR